MYICFAFCILALNDGYPSMTLHLLIIIIIIIFGLVPSICVPSLISSHFGMSVMIKHKWHTTLHTLYCPVCTSIEAILRSSVALS